MINYHEVNMSYTEFLNKKMIVAPPTGITVSHDKINGMLFEFQRDIVAWALKRGRAAVFADCGLGKTFIQIEWARLTGQQTLIVAPLCVAQQTCAEGAKIGVEVKYCRHPGQLKGQINITNYEMLHHFDPSAFGALVLDESSILKNYAGKYRTMITEFAAGIPFRLACTATPAPNDLMELVNHAEYLSIMNGKEIAAMFFIQDGNTTHKWRLKKHAVDDFWKWMASWCVAMRIPSDLGYENNGFNLPPLRFHDVTLEANSPLPGKLFVEAAQTLSERRKARRESIAARAAKAADIANDCDDPVIVWCDLNAESEALKAAIPDAVEVRGSDKMEDKESRIMGFTNGEHRVLITKPSIAGFGMNWQHCSNVIFTGLSDSYEQFYQAVRRCWRFGQKMPVDCYIITSDAEGEVVKNIKRKERQANELFHQVVANMQDLSEVRGVQMKDEMKYEVDDASGDGWRLMLGDCVERIKEIPDNSIGLSVFSPPFPGMYAYTNSARDIGNSSTIEQLMEHIEHLYPELLRVLMPGRSVAIHLTQMVKFKHLEGESGLKDFRGATIAAMERAGFVFYGEVTIDKCPQLKAQRTKDHGLLFKTLASDSSKMHMALADYLLQFRKPGENPQPIRAGISEKYKNHHGWITQDEWIEWAAPVWYRRQDGYPGGIRETDVLNVRAARDERDERHLCPLQLGVIERAIKLWSAPGDTVLDPFNGIGSTGYESLRWGREYIGIELKRSYYDQAIRYLEAAPRNGEATPLDEYLGDDHD